MEVEQLKFEFDFEEGEYKAPVSHLYKMWIREMLYHAVSMEDEHFYKYQLGIIDKALSQSAIFAKCNKTFKEEVSFLLNQPLESMYEMIMKKPMEKHSTDIGIKPELKLVK